MLSSADAKNVPVGPLEQAGGEVNPQLIPKVSKRKRGGSEKKVVSDEGCDTGKCRAWVFVYNEYPESDIEVLERLFKDQKVWYIFQREVGPKSGHPHLQGYFRNKGESGIRWTHYQEGTQGHMKFRRAKGGDASNWNYCSKQESKVPGTKLYTNMSEDMFEEPKKKARGLCRRERELAIIRENMAKVVADTIAPLYAEVKWKPWQQTIIDRWSQPATEANTRDVHWVYDTVGNVGKSFVADYLKFKYNVVLCDGKKNDIMHQVVKSYLHNRPYGVIVDVPRAALHKFQYDLIEVLMRRYCVSGKYEGDTPPLPFLHILVFANGPPKPDGETWSADRVKLVCLDPPVHEHRDPNYDNDM